MSQISDGGAPKYSSYPEVDESQVVPNQFDKPDIELLLEDDVHRDANGMNLRDAVAIPIGLNLTNSGTWFNLDEGGRIWRMTIQIPEAISLEAYYSDFFLPTGAEFFVFNEDGSEYYGAYTERNNKLSGRMTTEMIHGSTINFEYYEPETQQGQGTISILDLAFRYRDVAGDDGGSNSGGSQSCEVDVSCPEGNVWQNQSNSTVRIRTRINGEFFWCSGTLMNNTAQDCRPLLLTSLKNTIEGNDASTGADLDYYRFYFGHQLVSCGGEIINDGGSLSGCSRLGDSNDNGGALGSDYLLLELSSVIPSSYNVYYAGWDATPDAAIGGGVGIHHPSSDVKKVSSYTVTPVEAGWGINDTHWMINWSATENGHGVTENGSEGSALFNSEGRVIGTLTGGLSKCNEVQPGGQVQPDFYGKMSHHWSENPNPSSEKLRQILDPSGTNGPVFNGSVNPCGLVGVDDDVLIDLFSFYPNPADKQLKISANQEFIISSIILRSITGGGVLELDKSNCLERNVDTSSLPAGVYIISVMTEKGHQSIERLVISH